jgi:hypothetical protein
VIIILPAPARLRCISLSLLLFLSAICQAAPLLAESTSPQSRRQSEITYQDTTLTEDVSWRGTVLVKGYLVVAPQATLRIEPGTIVRFISGSGGRQLSRLVVLGRIQAVGTIERPIHFVPRQGKPDKSLWGGIQLLNSEKRNQLEYCRIEGAETAIDARFSTLTTKAVTVTASTNGVVLHDSIAGMIAATITDCDSGLEAHDSELEFKDASVSGNRTGMKMLRSSVIMSSVSIQGSTQQGIQSDDCRLKISSCEIIDNKLGASIKGGEGLLFLTRFMRNRDTALHLSGVRMKVNRCRISDNLRDGILLDDGRSVVWGNEFSGNSGYNLVYTGRESASAVRNWWGSADESVLMEKIKDGSGGPRFLTVYPWLTEKSNVLP